ncbi:MAG: ScyD/ScyE family protein [Tepidiformaceae bacterium]
MRAWLAVLAVMVAFGAPGCARTEPYLEGFHAPRGLRLAPDGRLLVTDLGTGNDDGRVVAVDFATKTQEVLLEGLPSTRGSGQAHADLAGPSGAAMAPDGTLCVVIGDAAREGAGFATLRCSDGLEVDLEAFERERNPDGLAFESNPYDVAWDGADGWYVSDAAANSVLRVGRDGLVTVLAAFPQVPGGRGEGVPTGLAVDDVGDLWVALFGGAVVVLRKAEAFRVELFSAPEVQPIAVDTTGDVSWLTHRDEHGAKGRGGINSGGRLVVRYLDRPTAMARLPGGRFAIAEEARGRVRLVGPSP